MPRLKCAVYGLGPIGRDLAQLAVDHPQFELCAAIDVAEELVGRDLHGLLGYDGLPTMEIVPSLPRACKGGKLDVIFHATGSRLDVVGPQLEGLLSSGANVISTCEELVFPWERNRAAAERLHKCGVGNNVSIIGAGVNPGFAMDIFPLLLAASTSRVDSISIVRRTDIGKRRLPLQQKLGVGIAESEFHRRKREGSIGHVGLQESLSLLAHVLGWHLASSSIDVAPVLIDARPGRESQEVSSDLVLGVNHIAKGVSIDGREISMVLDMHVGVDSYDSVEISGDPDIRVMVEGGFSGDKCTTAVVFNIAPGIVDSPPGMLTVADLRRMPMLPSGTAGARKP